MQIDEVVDLDENDFIKNYLNAEKPVLFKNYVSSWQASKWTLEILKKKAGHNSVFVRRNTAHEDYRTGKKYTIESMKFEEYISNIEKCNKKAYSSYLAVQNIKRALPELEPDIKIPKFVGKLHGGPFLWIAMKGHYEFCHFDPDDNFLIVFSGKKHVKLYPAKYLDNLYPNPLGSNGRTIQSCVDQTGSSEENYPKFLDVAEHYECTLTSGDMLFFPAFWWHQVTSVETTISMNIFCGNDGTNDYITKIMETNQYDAFKYWLLNIIEQNREHKQFKNVLENLPESLSNFLFKQWHEKLNEKQVTMLVNVVLEYLNLDRIPMQTKVFKYPPPLKIRGLLWRS